MDELALFAGAGGGILGGHLLGWRTICAVEWDAYAASILVHRQNDGSLPPFPIWDDVQTFDGRPWRGRVDVISGGFPCQDISSAGKGAGIDGERSGMWGHMARIIGQVRPEFCMVENSPLLVGRGLARVLGDLASLGYDAKWGVLGARDAGAPHKRDRIWIVAYNPSLGRGERRPGGSDPSSEGESKRPLQDVAHSECTGLEGLSGDEQGGSESGRECEKAGRSTGQESLCGRREEALADALCRGLPESKHKPRPKWSKDNASVRAQPADQGWWSTEPELGRVAHGVANRVDRLKCIGNGQVPHCAALAWRILNEWT
jgi:DNA (cytosine-5)-methyltransferase 1